MRDVLWVARAEWRELWRDGRLALAVSVLAALFAGAALVTFVEVRAFAGHQRAAQQATRTQWETQEDKNPHSAAHFGTYAFKTPSALAFLDRGIDAYAGIAVWIEAHKQNPMLFRPASDGSAAIRFGTLTPALVAQDLMPLLLLALAALSVSRDRESGLLRQLQATGLSLRRLMLGRLLALVVLAVGVALPGVALALAVVDTASIVVPGAETWARAGLWIAVHLVYWLIVLVLGVSLSAVARSPRRALSLSCGAWLLVAIVAPRLAVEVAVWRHPVPDGTAFAAAVARDLAGGADGHDTSSARAAAVRDQALARYAVSDAADLPIDLAGLVLQAGEEYGNEVFDRHHAALWAQHAAQDRWLRAVGWLAPRAPVQALSSALAGTDVAEHRHFTESAEHYRRELNRRMNLAVAYRGTAAQPFVAGRDFWAETPDFTYRPRTLGEVVDDQHLAFLTLAAWAFAAAAAWGWSTREVAR